MFLLREFLALRLCLFLVFHASMLAPQLLKEVNFMALALSLMLWSKVTVITEIIPETLIIITRSVKAYSQ